MRLFVIDPNTKEKKYLKLNAASRQDLRKSIGQKDFRIGEHCYSVNDVKAEVLQKTAPTMALGGVIGVAGGVFGVLAGVAIGALVGSSSENSDQRKADLFNGSHDEVC